MKKRFDVVTALDVCMDFLVSLGDVIPEFGQKEQLVKDFHIALGGSACIFASQCAKLGLKTAGAGTVGNDYFGGLFYQELKKSGVCMERVRFSEKVKTGAGIALNKDTGDRAILTYMGTIGVINQEDFTELVKNTRHLHIASYYLLKDIQKLYLKILPELKREQVTVSLDTNWDPMERWEDGLKQILPYVDILLANEQEILAISGEKTLTEAVRSLQKEVPVVVLKKGEKGAEAYKENKNYTVSGKVKVAVDTVGAGDSFDAGFIYGFLQEKSIEECLKIGCFCGEETVTRAGGVEGQPLLTKLEETFYKTNFKTKERE